MVCKESKIDSVTECARKSFAHMCLFANFSYSEPLWYYLTMFLSLMVAEALAQLVSHMVPHFVIGMALLAGTCRTSRFFSSACALFRMCDTHPSFVSSCRHLWFLHVVARFYDCPI